MFGRARVERALLKTGHIVRVLEDGTVVDLGPATDEDLELLEYVTREAASRLGVSRKRPGPSVATLTRTRAFAKRLHRGAETEVGPR